MFKKIYKRCRLGFVMCMLMGVAIFATGCGNPFTTMTHTSNDVKSEKVNKKSDNQKETSIKEYPEYPDYKALDYVKLGNYTHLDINVSKEDDENSSSVDSGIASKLVEICEVKEIPKELIDWYIDCNIAAYENAAAKSNQNIDKFVASQTGNQYKSMADLKKSWEETAENVLKIEVILHAIAEQEDITISDDEYNTQVDMYVAEYECKSVKDLYQYYKESNIRATILDNNTMDFVRANVTVAKK